MAQDEIEVKKEEKQEKVYTEKDFQEALKKEVARKLKQLGDGKIVNFSKELVDKENELKIKEVRYKKRLEELRITEKGLTSKISEFDDYQKKFLACLNEKDKKVSNRVGHMVDVISGMRPNKAAEVLSVQDPNISVKILGMLQPIKVSKIFNLMDKEISARLQKQYMTMKR
jgi:flagellar motility protein MotE (MotC chaperone)